ncbi:putative ERG24-C-14 sterol reductase [Microstroma glucosiphilum]|uniref:Delta(14)-sterol reductase ERG24 n=1 Tax=Pseudomicrostroma glucosiphilum TaxID=1684307 RepID=A0A316U092_9BASI|nr:putative ERG24-C-14 sterol reductase [Pseudomicrostroma glucosiphilum]PWN18822.1 putative ERG24-C-14 sterol reductase [Pseudomicrostroma glucosiphilum]
MATEDSKSNGHASAVTSALSGGNSSSPAAGKRVTRSEAHKSKEVLAPKSEHYEFGGPLGCLFVSTAVPLTSYGLFYFCNGEAGCAVPPENWRASLDLMLEGVVKSCFDWKAWAIYFGWYAFTVLAWAVLPGPWVEGTELRTGVKLKYKINAFSTMVLSLFLTALLIAFKGPESFTLLYDHWEGLVTASLFNSVAQAIYCYAVSFQEDRLLAKAANTGNFIHDWFLGRELNPRIGTFDIKYFNELRPGLILWVLLDISCACAQYAKEGQITDSMFLILLFQGAYVFDGLWNEPAILTTMDITTDGFGFMLSVGDLTWVPFTYTLQARFLVFHPVYLGIAGTLAIFAFNGLGYYIFRVANGEKNQFRSGNNPKNLKYMTTSSGRKLITSGWWGRSRHPNYMGDLIMGLAWSLPCGFSTPIPYFYIIYFTVLLVHRQIRDDDACRLKYGDDWDKYCEKVPWKIIPGVY